MKKTILIVLLIILVFLIGFFIGKINSTGKTVQEFDRYTHTRAICSGNRCIDVMITCENKEVIGIEPVSELVELGDNWSDVRNDTGLC